MKRDPNLINYFSKKKKIELCLQIQTNYRDFHFHTRPQMIQVGNN